MGNYISETDLIINPNGSIYHLGVKPGDIAKTIILVGDPDRVPTVSSFFDHIDFTHENREIRTHTGTIAGMAISVISTGMGTDNIDIVLTEIDALFNVDFKTRETREKHTQLRFVRLGTSGCLQSDIEIDSIVVSEIAIGFDALAHYYEPVEPSSKSKLFWNTFQEHFRLHFEQSAGYIIESGSDLYSAFASDFLPGITATCPGFYGPQGRNVRAKTNKLGGELLSFLERFENNGRRVTNFEMETSGIYLMSKLLGHQAVSISAILANRVTKQFSKQADKTVKAMIEKSLHILVKT